MSELKQAIDQFRANVTVREPPTRLGGRPEFRPTIDPAQFEAERKALEARLAQVELRRVAVQHLPLLMAFLGLLWIVVWFAITAWILRNNSNLGTILAGEGTFFVGSLGIVALMLKYQVRQSRKAIVSTKEEAIRLLLRGSLPDFENASDYVRLVEAVGEVIDRDFASDASTNAELSHQT